MLGRPRLDITGQKFNMLTAIKFIEVVNEKSLWLFKCDCGNEVINCVGNVKSGTTKACGCLFKFDKGEASFNELVYRYKRDAKRRNLDFNLDLNLFRKLTKQNCYYCNTEPAQKIGKVRNNGTYIYNGIDRLINSIGYNESNCVPCCGVCNKAKLQMDKDVFLNWISRVYTKNCMEEAKKLGITVLEVKE